MKLEKAYSIDLERDITAQDADHHFEKGSIVSKYKFECSDENCSAQIICANLNRPKALRKRDPYFKAVEEHSTDCEIGKAIRERPSPVGEADSPYGTDVPIQGLVRLNLSNPPAVKPKSSKGGLSGGVITGNGPSRGRGQSGDGERVVTTTKTLSSLVSAFLNEEEFDIELPGSDSIRLSDLFIKVDEQDISCLEDDYRIYFGKAFFNKRNDGNGFFVRFDKPLQSGELIKRPTFFISNEAIEACVLNKFELAKLERLADRKPKNIFILTDTAPVPNPTGEFINFNLEALHYMDYRDA
ncbi:hypothetical protein [Alteromonas gracilis]|uniref:hypothetical protein n=1 Tax=Alteromonas gracilis TaxID=1479524 RepID=UPI0030CD4F5D